MDGIHRLFDDGGRRCDHCAPRLFSIPSLIFTEKMRAVIQRVSYASVTIGPESSSSTTSSITAPTTAIAGGLLVLLGIEETDDPGDIEWLSAKIVNLRIFDDADGVMNLSIKDSGGDILLVSQFTLFGSTKKGNRPSWIRAAKAETAIPLYEKMIARLSADLGKPILTGEFGADMKVQLLNDGPVTILIDTKNKE
jgi:D-tyrosyl-tRNA(Tyr) deacylase